jgi:hypothetical protein
MILGAPRHAHHHNARVDTVGLAAHSMTTDALTRRTPQKANPSSLALLVFLGLSLAAVDAIRVNCQTTNRYEKNDLGAVITDDLGRPIRVVAGRERQCSLIVGGARLSSPAWLDD